MLTPLKPETCFYGEIRENSLWGFRMLAIAVFISKNFDKRPYDTKTHSEWNDEYVFVQIVFGLAVGLFKNRQSPNIENTKNRMIKKCCLL